MSSLFLLLVVLLVASYGEGFTIPRLTSKVLAQALVGSSIAFQGVSSIAPMNINIVHAAESVSVFEGKYNDPNHPGCLRKITVKDKNVKIIGSDNIDGSNQWIILAKEDLPGTMFVDFSPKGGPSNLLGVFEPSVNGIVWPDKNVWKKI